MLLRATASQCTVVAPVDKPSVRRNSLTSGLMPKDEIPVFTQTSFTIPHLLLQLAVEITRLGIFALGQVDLQEDHGHWNIKLQHIHRHHPYFVRCQPLKQAFPLQGIPSQRWFPLPSIGQALKGDLRTSIRGHVFSGHGRKEFQEGSSELQTYIIIVIVAISPSLSLSLSLSFLKILVLSATHRRLPDSLTHENS